MKYPSPLFPATLLRRYKRFLADVAFPDGSQTTVHCPNTGSMLGCSFPGSRIWLSRASNPKRKYPYTWELVELKGGTLVGINTTLSNHLVREAVDRGRLPGLGAVESVRQEVRFGRESSRVDLLVKSPHGLAYVEVKNVTAAVEDGIAVFPDAVTTRGRRHLRELAGVVRDGHAAVLVFCVQREDVREVRPADQIDPEYGAALRAAIAAGVQAVALRATVRVTGVELTHSIPVICETRLRRRADSTGG